MWETLHCKPTSNDYGIGNVNIPTNGAKLRGAFGGKRPLVVNGRLVVTINWKIKVKGQLF